MPPLSKHNEIASPTRIQYLALSESPQTKGVARREKGTVSGAKTFRPLGGRRRGGFSVGVVGGRKSNYLPAKNVRNTTFLATRIVRHIERKKQITKAGRIILGMMIWYSVYLPLSNGNLSNYLNHVSPNSIIVPR